MKIYCHWVSAGLLALVALTGCTDAPPKITRVQRPAESQNKESIQNIVSSEELILNLTPRLGELNRAAMNLEILSGQAKSMFHQRLQVIDVESTRETSALNDYIQKQQWSLASKKQSIETGIWRPFLESVAYLDSAKFYFIDGTLDSKATLLKSTMGFASHFKSEDGRIGYATAKIKADWDIPKNRSEAKIVDWETTSFKSVVAPSTFFQDVTGSLIDDKQLRNTLSGSVHQSITETLVSGEKVPVPTDDRYKMFFPEITLEHPAISIVDYDNDGWDDFFLSRPHRSAVMFKNMGDGRFQPKSKELGIDLGYDCTCSLFADFDNDGDQDAFIGRGRHRAVYLSNENGRYVDHSDRISIELPFLVSSIASVDYDNDGLLDVYFSTYSPIEGAHDQVDGFRWPSFFLSGEQQRELEILLLSAHPILDMVGPPNVLLKNAGEGKFELSRHSSTAGSWRKSFQSSWCDFDQDGDPDLYVCNDFAKDDFYRNDGEDGFVNISNGIGLDRLGFGMGVAWGDYDQDGQFDLYVSNMFSKAGTRITRQLKDLDPRLQHMATGNYLYRFNGQKFELTSIGGKHQATAKTGWSWGGQFADLDNDGKLEIVVANGYYSAPPNVAGQIDL